MKPHLSTIELANILAVSPRAVQKRAKDERWPYHAVENDHGGGTRHLYTVRELPRTVREKVGDYFSRAVADEKPREIDSTGAAIWAQLPKKEKSIALARLEVLRAADRWASAQKSASRSKVKQLEEFYMRLGAAVEAGNEDALRLIGLPWDRMHDIKAHVRSATIKTDYRWRSDMDRAERETGLAILGLVRTQRIAPGYGAKTLSPEIVAYARQLILDGQVKIFPESRDKASGRVITCNRTNLFSRLDTRFGAASLPSYAHFTRWLNAYLAREQESLCAIVLPGFWRSTFAPSAGCASAEAEYAGQMWELDGTRADVMLADGRYEVLGAIDLYSRDVVVEIQKDASSITVAKLLYNGITRWGRPEKIIVDNGSIFVSEHITGACEALDISMHKCRAYSPNEKPHIESFMCTLAKMLWESCAWFIGHDPKQRKRIDEYHSFSKVFYHRRSEKVSCDLTADEFRKVVDDWINKVYRSQLHEFADLHLGRSRSVLDRLTQSPRRAQKISNPEALETLLSPPIERAFDSGIDWYGKYRPCDIASWEKAQAFQKQKVLFRPQLSDIGRGTLWEIRPDGKVGNLICHVSNEERGGISLEEFNQAKKQINRRHRERKKAIETLTKPERFETDLERMPEPKLMAANFGAAEWDGGSYRNLVEYKDAPSRIPKRPERGWLKEEEQQKLEAELREKEERARNERAQRSCDRAPASNLRVIEPSTCGQDYGEAYWNEIRDLQPADRYERVLECEARRIEVPTDLKRDARYFEHDPVFTRLKSYFESKKAQFALIYQN
ncbi:MAG: transposase family protein [Syntrophobacter sp.]